MADGSPVADVPNNTVAEAVPVPPRYWWLKRIAAGLVVLAVVLGVVRWWWGVYARRALQAEIDSYVAAGQPVYESDFLLPPIPDEQNAAVLLRQVKAQLDSLRATVSDLNKTTKLRSDFTNSTEVTDEVLSLLAGTSELRAIARQAARLPAVQWRPDENLILVNYSRMLDLLVLSALAEHRQGNCSEALAVLRDVVGYGRHVSKNATQIAAIIYGNGVRCVADVVEEMLATRPSSPGNLAGVRLDVGLIRGLLDEIGNDCLQEAYCRGLYRERSWHLENLNRITETPSLWFGHGWFDRIWGRLAAPLVQLDGVRVLRRDTAWAKAMAAPDLPSCVRQAPSALALPQAGLKFETRSFTRWALPDWTDRLNVFWGNIARQRMLALALAIRLYEEEHGTLPTHLNELAPAYLPALPRNPYVSDGGTFELDAADPHPCLRARDADNHERAVFYLKGKPVGAVTASRAD